MITLHLSLATIIAVLAILALIAVSLGVGLYCLLRAYRLGQFKNAVDESKEEIRKATTEAVKAIKAATASNSEQVLELVEQLQDVREGIRHLAPHDIQDALNRVAKLHAKDMTEKYLDQLKEMATRIELYQLWLRALTGGPRDIDRAAMRVSCVSTHETHSRA
ncbi:hypothetical protein [Dongia mobilis]|uniref:hypothetical protein n=1 Tax=Dongia sp. TaxID=1977262 RepID=UPI0026E9FA65